MYGTVFRMKALPGKAQRVQDLFEDWRAKRQPGVAGAHATYLFRLDADPETFIGVAVFADKQSYSANADDPAQDAWFKELRAELASDPEWMDGDVSGG